MKEPRIYVYKCVVDDGGAPCIDDEVLTLTICKPYIRSTARPGDLIFAFGSNYESPANRLIYIAEVKQRLSNGAYFDRDEFKHRRDCIYERLANGRLGRRADAIYHNDPEARVSDLGDEGRYQKANALLSTNFRYFGKKGTDGWKSHCPMLRELVEKLGQGHRVNFSPSFRLELLQLKELIWNKYPHQRILGKPLHAPNERTCPDPVDTLKVCALRCFHITRE